MSRTVVILAIALIAVVMGCSEDQIQCNGVLVGNTCFPDTPGCQSDQDCMPTGVCLNGSCGQECTSDAQCLNGYVCQTYRCIPGGGDPGKDTVDPPEDTRVPLQDTPEPLLDTDAPIPCQNHLDCDAFDMACIEGFCGDDTVDPPADTVDPPPDTVGDCPPKNGAYGNLCDCKEQCATQLCVQNFQTDQNTCTQYCTGDINCPGTDICVMVEQGVNICYYNDAGVTSTSCDPDQASCFKGMVLNNQLGQCVCTVPCVDAAGSCPNGMACHFDQSFNNQKYCVAVGDICTVAQNPCYSGSCLGDGQTGYCTAICVTTADCPAGWLCQDVGGPTACVAP